MAEWTAAYINELPDSAFAYVEPGDKDETGRTTPRSLRHFPIRDSAGDYDAAHVRNALARLSQSPFERQARPAVEAAAKALGIGAAQEAVVDVDITEFGKADTDTEAVPVAEVGRVFSAANETALRAIANAVNALLAQVQQAPIAGAAPPADSPPAPPGVPTEGGASPDEVIAQESAIPLAVEAAKGGKGLIKVIDAGWGTSGFYSPDVLARDAAAAFPAGTKMFWDHPSVNDGRPERSLRDLAAELVEDARWMKDGPEGPGVYAPASVFSAYRPAIEELKDSIGVSIRASAHVKQGKAAGRKGPIIERLLPSPTNSVDFVTIPGRGGRVAALFEAARGRNDDGPEAGTTTEDDNVSEAELQAAREAAQAAEQRAIRAEAAAAVLAARAIAAEVLAGVDIPEPARLAVAERVVIDPPMVEGALDADAFRQRVTDEAGKEKAYIDRLTGRGEVRGMGSGATEAAAAPDEAALSATFQRLGLSESAAKRAAAGRR